MVYLFSVYVASCIYFSNILWYKNKRNSISIKKSVRISFRILYFSGSSSCNNDIICLSDNSDPPKINILSPHWPYKKGSDTIRETLSSPSPAYEGIFRINTNDGRRTELWWRRCTTGYNYHMRWLPAQRGSIISRFNYSLITNDKFSLCREKLGLSNQIPISAQWGPIIIGLFPLASSSLIDSYPPGIIIKRSEWRSNHDLPQSLCGV